MKGWLLYVLCLVHFCFKMSFYILIWYKSSPPEVLLGKGILKICSKYTEEHPCRSVMLCNFIEITLWHGCSPVNLLHIFSTPFPKNTYGGLHLNARWFATSLDRPITVFFKKQDNMSKFLRKCLIYFHKKCLYKQML